MTGLLAIQAPLTLLMSVVAAVLPLTLVFLVFQWLFLRLPRAEIVRLLKATLVASAGLYLFLLGVGVGFLPAGAAIGEALGKTGSLALLILLGLLLGFVTTWGEPSVRILAEQVDTTSGGSIRATWVVWAICLGVAVATGVGLLRIGHGIPLLHVLVPGYLIVMIVAWRGDSRFTAVAIDAGGVATGPLANSFLLALALGTAAGSGSSDPLVQGLGLVALVALAPVLAVMALGAAIVRRTPPEREEP